MTLTARDLAQLRALIEDALARHFAPGEGSVRSKQCHDNEKSESTDPTNTASAGESSSPERQAIEALYRLRRKPKPSAPPTPRAVKRKAAR